jgi:hypothetical protein
MQFFGLIKEGVTVSPHSPVRVQPQGANTPLRVSQVAHEEVAIKVVRELQILQNLAAPHQGAVLSDKVKAAALKG